MSVVMHPVPNGKDLKTRFEGAKPDVLMKGTRPRDSIEMAK
jgi:hypothetical protein